MNTVTPLPRPWHDAFEELVRTANTRLVLCAPFITQRGVASVRRARIDLPAPTDQILVLTDLSPLAVCAGTTDPIAVSMLQDALPTAKTIHLPRLHAKVYIADRARAIVTSGNLTQGGLSGNYEYGVKIDEPRLAARIEADMFAISKLGGEINPSTLHHYCELAAEIRKAYAEQTASSSRAAARRLRSVLRTADESLIRAKLAGGALHTVFARTVEYLLRIHRRLTTEQLHPLIQQIHPDLCDDSVDRVIDGVRYGKKWKHAVRSAQQQLKKQGLIELQGKTWTRVAAPRNGHAI